MKQSWTVILVLVATIGIVVAGAFLAKTGMDWISLAAIVLGPIIALRLEKAVEDHKERQERRLRVFRTLMVTRGSTLSLAHVEALNSIDLEFDTKGKEDQEVRDAWKAYLDHLSSFSDTFTTDQASRWTDGCRDLLADLLAKMSTTVGYKFDRTHIKRAAYTPRRYGELESEQDLVRRAVLEVFTGNRPFPVFVVPPKIQETPTKRVE